MTSGPSRKELPVGSGAIILGLGIAAVMGLLGLGAGGWGLVAAMGMQLPLISTAMLVGGLFKVVADMRSDPVIRTKRGWALVVVGSLTTVLIVWLWAPVYGGMLEAILGSWRRG